MSSRIRRPSRATSRECSRNSARPPRRGSRRVSAERRSTPSPNRSATWSRRSRRVYEYWLSDPRRAIDAQTHLLTSYFGIWSNSISRFTGDPTSVAPPDGPKDKRFSDEDWEKHAFFDFLRQAYLVTIRLGRQAWSRETDGLDEHTRQKAAFYTRQITSALSPTNFVLTNPEVYRETIAANGENLVKGMRMLAEDIAEGRGELKLRQSDQSEIQDRREPGAHPGKGRRAERTLPDHPVCSCHGEGAEAPASHLPALDQQVLRPRPQPAEVLRALGGRAGATRSSSSPG